MREKIRTYKCCDGQKIISSIRVKNADGHPEAYLVPVTELIFDYPEYITKLVEWRTNNPTVSNNYFDVTVEGTKKWIKNIILNDDKKIFFIIFDNKSNPIGQMGISNINMADKSGYIYAVIKGEKDAQKGIMERCLREMMVWGNKELNLCKYYLDVQETNERAIRLYTKIGFEKIARIPLIKVETENEIRWVAKDTYEAEKYDIRMEYIL